MISHQRCKKCDQRKNQSEYTNNCPASAYGHQWETVSGNGISWNESYAGKLWNKSAIGKIIIIVLGLLLLLMLS